jgi:DNA repair protein RadC
MWQHMYDAPAPTLRDPSPSPEDIVVTRKLVEAGELLDVGVLDHIIIGRQSFVSLKDRGLGF